MTPTASPPVERTVETAGSPVHVHMLGEGPPVLLLHGSGPGTTGWGAWRAVAERLAAGHLVVVPDQAGFGATPLPADRGDAPDWSRAALWTEQAVGAMDALGLGEYAVVGHSMGGAVALALAARRPDAITRVVAVATMGAQMPLTTALDRLWGAAPGLREARELLSGLFFDPGLVTDEAVRARAAAMHSGARAFAPLFPAPRDRWVRDLALGADVLAHVGAPVLLVHGANDRLTPIERTALPLLEHLPDARLHAFGRCGHVPAVEHHAAFVRLLTDFLETDA